MLSAEQRSRATALDDELATLLKQQAEVEHRILLNRIERAELRPVYALHDDILKLIFEEACSPKLAGGTVNVNISPITISHVCRRWRNISLLFPQMWNYIQLSLAHPLVRLYVERSGNVIPIHVAFLELDKTLERGNVDLKDKVTDDFTANLNCALQHRGRWISFFVQTSLYSLASVVNKLVADHELPMVKFLYLGAHHLRMPNCPSLLSLAMSRLKLPLGDSILRDVREVFLSYRELDATEFHELLRVALRLERLTVERIVPDWHLWGFGADTTVLAPCLRELDLIKMDWNDNFLHFQAPQLSTICYKNSVVSMHEPEESPSSAPYLAVQHVRFLRTIVTSSPDSLDGYLLRRFPNTTHCELLLCAGTNVILDCLNLQHESDFLMPLLATLTIDLRIPHPDEQDLGGMDNVGRALHDLVEARVRRKKPLRELRLSTTTVDALGPQLLASLSALIAVRDVPHDPQHDLETERELAERGYRGRRGAPRIIIAGPGLH